MRAQDLWQTNPTRMDVRLISSAKTSRINHHNLPTTAQTAGFWRTPYTTLDYQGAPNIQYSDVGLLNNI